MKKNNTEAKLSKKRALLVERTALALNIVTEEAEELLNTGRQQSLRLNPIRYSDKAELLDELAGLGWSGNAYLWADNCFSIDSGLEALKDSQLVQKGSIYIQNAASWLPVLALDPQPTDRILDMCAAPGGKAGHIAAVTNNKAELWINDNSRPRLAKLKANFVRLGVLPDQFTLYDARYLTKKLPTLLFDKILLDAPCSGEGMLSLNSDKDLFTWSVAHIRRLQSLQKQLIMQAWQFLKPGGTLVYSTCTIAPEENEMVIDYLLRKTEDAKIINSEFVLGNRIPALLKWNNKQLNTSIKNCLRLAPSSKLEAFFVARVCKSPVV